MYQHHHHQRGPFEGDFDRVFEELGKAARGLGDFLREAVEEGGAWMEGEARRQGKGFEWRFDADACGPGPAGDYGFPFHPRSNVYKNSAGDLVFEFLLPGFEESGLQLGFSGDSMVLKARLPEELRNREGAEWRRRGFVLREVERREYPVPAERYEQEKAKAVFKNGILTVTIPSKDSFESAEGIRVEIVKEGN